MTRVRFVLDPFWCKGHYSSQDLDLFGIFGLGPGDVDFDFVRIAKDSLGVVSPSLAGDDDEVVAMDKQPNVLTWVVEMAGASSSPKEASLCERSGVVLTPAFGGI